MAIKNKIIKIDIEKSIQKVFEYKRYKDDGTMFFSILEDNQEVDLSGYTAKVYCQSHNKIFSIQCNILNNIVEFPLTEDISLEKGVVSFEIVFTNKRQKVTTFRMYLKI